MPAMRWSQGPIRRRRNPISQESLQIGRCVPRLPARGASAAPRGARTMPDKLRVLVVGLGHMGVSHAKAYDRIDGYELAGLCARSIAGRDDLPAEWADIPRFSDYYEALEKVKPDVVAVCTWPNTHAEYAIAA